MIMDPAATHLPYLLLAVLKFGGPVLEVGCGMFSTPMLRTLLQNDVGITSLEKDPFWVKVMHDRGIEVKHEPNMEKGVNRLREHPWKIVFVDCHQEDRIPAIEAFLNHGCVIVVHDTEASYFGPFLPTVKYVRTFNELCPHTSWLSNVTDVHKV